MVSNAKVVEMWSNGEDAQSKNMTSADGYLFSYDLIIGMTVATVEGLRYVKEKLGRKVVLDFTAQTNHYRSQSTSTHVNLAKQYSDAIVNPSYDTLYDVFAGDEVWELVNPKKLPHKLADAIDLGVKAKVNEIHLKSDEDVYAIQKLYKEERKKDARRKNNLENHERVDLETMLENAYDTYRFRNKYKRD